MASDEVAGSGESGPSDEVALLDGLATTRAIRRYRDEPVLEDDLATIMWHATRAPSGSNRQPFRFVVLREANKPVAASILVLQAGH